MKRLRLVIVYQACMLLFVAGAWADAPANYTWSNAPGGSFTASSVDFAAWMTKLAQFQFGGNYVFDFLDPTNADNNDNDVLDVNEFALLTAICNDTSHPQHDLIHEAFKTNWSSFQSHQGALVNSLASALAIMGGAYATLGDGDYGRTPAPWFAGSWGSVAEILYELSSYGSSWNAGQPAEPPYIRRQAYMSMCGDFDGDGVKNINEWYGQGQNVANYVNAAMNPSITTSGEDPSGVCETGLRWGKTYFYNPANQHVYWLQPYTLPWQISEQVATEHSLVNNDNETIAIPGHLVTIDDSAENAWIMSTVYPKANSNMWIGATDKDVEGQWIWIGTGEQFWQGASDGNPVGGKYANWNGGEPNDAGGAEDYGEITGGGGWNDNKASATRRGLVEFPNAYPDNNSNGIPDFWEQFSGGGGGEGEGTVEGTPEGEGEVPCPYDKLINDPATGQGPLLSTTLQNASSQLSALLGALGMSSWFNWDIEYLEVIGMTRPYPGDGLKDSWSMALLEYCLCHPNFRPDLKISEDFEYNKTLFTNDCNWLATHVDPIFAVLPPMVGDVMAGLLGSSVEMRTTWNALFLLLTGGAVGLPSVNSYRIYGMAKANDGAIAANGDLDGDGKTNLQEAGEVIAVGGDMELFVKAATDRTNMWPGNPEIPVGTIATLGAIAGVLIAGGSVIAIRRKKSSE